MALGHFCVGLSGTGTFLCWTEWHWDIFVLDRVVLGHSCVGPSGTGKFFVGLSGTGTFFVGLSGTGTFLCWTEWHWDIFVLDRVVLGHLCWTEWHWDIFVLDRVALGHICVGPSGTGTFLC